MIHVLLTVQVGVIGPFVAGGTRNGTVGILSPVFKREQVIRFRSVVEFLKQSHPGILRIAIGIQRIGHLPRTRIDVTYTPVDVGIIVLLIVVIQPGFGSELFISQGELDKLIKSLITADSLHIIKNLLFIPVY